MKKESSSKNLIKEAFKKEKNKNIIIIGLSVICVGLVFWCITSKNSVDNSEAKYEELKEKYEKSSQEIEKNKKVLDKVDEFIGLPNDKKEMVLQGDVKAIEAKRQKTELEDKKKEEKNKKEEEKKRKVEEKEEAEMRKLDGEKIYQDFINAKDVKGAVKVYDKISEKYPQIWDDTKYDDVCTMIDRAYDKALEYFTDKELGLR